MKTRAIGVIVLISGASISEAQFLAYRSAASLIRDLQLRNLIPVSDPGTPLAPTRSESEPTGKTGDIPAPETDDTAFQIIRTGTSHQRDNQVEMSGGVEFMYKGYHVFADSASGDIGTHIFSLIGDVKLVGKDAAVSGDHITVDFDKKLYHAFDAKADMKPGSSKGSFIKDMYFRGRESFGSASEQQVLYGGITSCDLLHPHYELEGESINVRPGRRAIFRKARIKLFGRTVLKVPFLVIPLDSRSQRNQPRVGMSEQEGYFIKTRFGVPMPENTDLFWRLDYMSKLGVGIGADYLYKNTVSNGNLQVYSIVGPGQMIKIADQHQQKFAWGTLAVDTDYENNNYLVQPGSVLQTEKALLTFPQKGNALTRLAMSYQSSSSQGLTNSTETLGVSDSRKFGQDVTTTVDVNYQQSNSKFLGGTNVISNSNQNLNIKVDGQDDLNKAVAEIQYQRQIPIGSTQALYGSNDMTPEVSLSSDSKRLMGNAVNANWPFKTSFSIGEFSDEFGNGHITRDSFDFKFQHPDHSTTALHTDFGGEFKQGVYSDGTAQYQLNFADNDSYKLTKDTSLNLHYNYLRPYGYTPLSIDQSGQQNIATADLSVKPVKTLSIGAQSGYDMLRLQRSEVAWQPVGVRMEWQPKDYLLMRTQATYDTFQGAWSNVRIDTSYRPGATFISLGSYYDGLSHTWSNVNAFVDNLTWGKTKVSAILTYDGYLKEFSNQQYAFTYDLHCWEAVLTYQLQQTGFAAGRTVSFMLRLKALPFTSLFGSTSRGAPLGTGSGTSL